MLPSVANSSFDSYLYLHDMNQPHTSKLLPVQVATGEHATTVPGYQKTERALRLRTTLECLRPKKTNKWIVLFVVPDDIAASFGPQKLKVPKGTPTVKRENLRENWVSKTTQYVLAVPPRQLMVVRILLQLRLYSI